MTRAEEIYTESLHLALDDVLMLLLSNNGCDYDYNCIETALVLLTKGHKRGYPLSMTLVKKLGLDQLKESINDET